MGKEKKIQRSIKKLKRKKELEGNVKRRKQIKEDIIGNYIYIYMFTKFLSFPVFMCSLVVGVLFVYLSTPPPTIIYVYPTPEEHSRNGSDN